MMPVSTDPPRRLGDPLGAMIPYAFPLGRRNRHYGSKGGRHQHTEVPVYKENIKSAFVVNCKITNTAIGRDVRDALAAYPVHVLDASVAQRVVFAEAAAQGQAIFEIDPTGPAVAEMEAVAAELMEYAK